MSTENTDENNAQAADVKGAAESNKAQDGETTKDAAGAKYEEYKKKIEQHLGELGKQMDSLKEVLGKAANDARVSIEHEMEKLKKEHAGEFERLSKLHAAGEAGLHTLGARLDKLVEDVTVAVTSALGISRTGDKAGQPGQSGQSDKAAGETKAEAAPAPAEPAPPAGDK